MRAHKHFIILFTRYPTPGKCKTRLIPSMGEQGAAEVHEKLTRKIVSKLDQLQNVLPHRAEIHYDGCSLKEMKDWLGQGHQYEEQNQGDLGRRMALAICQNLGNHEAIILLGSDCPGINVHILTEALNSLTAKDLVIGPAHDGGYYLIGVSGGLKKKECASLFQDIAWGTDQVFEETLTKARKLKLIAHILPKLHDIDTPADLQYFDHHTDP